MIIVSFKKRHLNTQKFIDRFLDEGYAAFYCSPARLEEKLEHYRSFANVVVISDWYVSHPSVSHPIHLTSDKIWIRGHDAIKVPTTRILGSRVFYEILSYLRYDAKILDVTDQARLAR